MNFLIFVIFFNSGSVLKQHGFDLYEIVPSSNPDSPEITDEDLWDNLNVPGQPFQTESFRPIDLSHQIHEKEEGWFSALKFIIYEHFSFPVYLQRGLHIKTNFNDSFNIILILRLINILL